VEFLDAQIGRLDDLIIPLVTARAPGLLSLYGVGPDTVGLLLIAAGDRPERLRSEAAWAHMCAVAPIPASSGKTRRHRLNREANHALWRIVITRMSAHPATRAYLERRIAEGLSKKEIIRCPKRYVAAAGMMSLSRRPGCNGAWQTENASTLGRCRAAAWAKLQVRTAMDSAARRDAATSVPSRWRTPYRRLIDIISPTVMPAHPGGARGVVV
jgi:Transposase IS116/IS110/IS902 family